MSVLRNEFHTFGADWLISASSSRLLRTGLVNIDNVELLTSWKLCLLTEVEWLFVDFSLVFSRPTGVVLSFCLCFFWWWFLGRDALACLIMWCWGLGSSWGGAKDPENEVFRPCDPEHWGLGGNGGGPSDGVLVSLLLLTRLITVAWPMLTCWDLSWGVFRVLSCGVFRVLSFGVLMCGLDKRHCWTGPNCFS